MLGRVLLFREQLPVSSQIKKNLDDYSISLGISTHTVVSVHVHNAHAQTLKTEEKYFRGKVDSTSCLQQLKCACVF